MINGVPYDLETRVADLERQLTGLGRRSSEQRYGRDGRAVLSVRLGTETCALVRHIAKERGCTIADLLRPAILATVNAPSTTPPPSVPQAKTPSKQMAPRIADRPSDGLGLFLARRLNQPARKAAVQHPGAALLRDRIGR
jgi:hypothetical protein